MRRCLACFSATSCQAGTILCTTVGVNGAGACCQYDVCTSRTFLGRSGMFFCALYHIHSCTPKKAASRAPIKPRNASVGSLGQGGGNDPGRRQNVRVHTGRSTLKTKVHCACHMHAALRRQHPAKAGQPWNRSGAARSSACATAAQSAAGLHANADGCVCGHVRITTHHANPLCVLHHDHTSPLTIYRS